MHLNAEFQRIARRDKKAFFSDQCKEIEENNRMGKTRDLFKKIRENKGTFHAKLGSIKDKVRDKYPYRLKYSLGNFIKLGMSVFILISKFE